MIAFVFIPYIGRPLRGQVLALRNREFVEASTAQGAGSLRIMFTELLPNITSSVLVLLHPDRRERDPHRGRPLVPRRRRAASPPLVGDDDRRRPGRARERPVAEPAPGIAITITVVSLNVFGDGLRDALDPRAKVRIEH